MSDGPNREDERRKNMGELAEESVDLATEVVSVDMLKAAGRGIGQVVGATLDGAANVASGSVDLAVATAEGAAEAVGTVVGGALEVLGALLD